MSVLQQLVLDTFDTSLLLRLCTTTWVPNYCYAQSLLVAIANCALYHTIQYFIYAPCSKYHCLSILGANWSLIRDLWWGSWLQCRRQLGQCLFGNGQRNVQSSKTVRVYSTIIEKKNKKESTYQKRHNISCDSNRHKNRQIILSKNSNCKMQWRIMTRGQ